LVLVDWVEVTGVVSYSIACICRIADLDPKMMLPPRHKPCLMVDWFLAAYDRKLSGRTWQSHFQWHAFPSSPSSLSLLAAVKSMPC